jgi:hypothetical protein
MNIEGTTRPINSWDETSNLLAKLRDQRKKKILNISFGKGHEMGMKSVSSFHRFPG